VFGLQGSDEVTERDLRLLLYGLLDDAADLDAAVVLAFDAVYGRDGRRDDDNTHLYVANDYVMEMSAEHPKVLFGASIHPYRPDAIAELERCVKAGAALVKWLPITQGIDPSDPICFEFYEAMAHHRIPLLSHTGGEKTLPNLNHLRSPALLAPALERGVTVIAAHCGTRSVPWEEDHVPTFIRMTRQFEHLYGDTSALNWSPRSYAWPALLSDERARSRLVHGSDWPILPLPPVHLTGMEAAWEALREKNWLVRDMRIKQALGLVEDDYWQRAGKIIYPLALTTRRRQM
jgi:predicted TIM-barrel fold metal-dependent hydrolase